MSSNFGNVVSSVSSTEDFVNDPFIAQMMKDLERHEGYRFYAYPDPLSKLYKKYPGLLWGRKPARELLALIKDMDAGDGAPWTVGYGDTHGVTPDSTQTKDVALVRLEQHILTKRAAMEAALPWIKQASFVTQTTVLNMVFNMGLRGVQKFVNTLRFIQQKDYARAAHNMTLSLWYRQTGIRAKELVERMRTQSILPTHKAKDT